MKGNFIVKIDMCSDDILIAKFVSIQEGTMICRDAICINDDQLYHQEVSFKLSSIKSFAPVNDIDYTLYNTRLIIQNKIKSDATEIRKTYVLRKPEEINDSDEVLLDRILSDVIIKDNEDKKARNLEENNLIKDDDKSSSQIPEKDYVTLSPINNTAIYEDNCSFLKKVISFFVLVLQKMFVLKIFSKFIIKKNNRKIKKDHSIPEFEVDFNYFNDHDEINIINLKSEKTELARFPKIIENFFEVYYTIDVNNLHEKQDLRNSKLAFDFLSRNHNETKLIVLNAKNDVVVNNFNLENTIIKNEMINKEDLLEPTVVKTYNSPSFLRYLEEKKRNEERYKKKLSSSEIRKLDEKQKNINKNGYKYGKQHYLYVGNEKKSSFNKKSICKTTGRYNHPGYIGQQSLYLLNVKEIKYAYKSKSNKKYKKKYDVIDEKINCRNPIIISSTKKSEKNSNL